MGVPLMNLDADDPVYRRRALAAHVVTLAVRVELAIASAEELDCPIPDGMERVPARLVGWADAIQRTRP